ncbi:MAG: DUF1707 domain-containing protein [Streptosporangiaceae bacterium]|nr:DUF1707 domain-containing protein [Streptosporangiaceae bacterium]MBV9852938.1 DUF1707 domain-containing protein [Streptosporangiaceae bacterium]
MATGFNVRVGDADRDATAAELREHYASGRLTLEELNERLDQAFAAKTRADLTAVMRDLPSTGRAAAGAPLASSGVVRSQGGSGSGSGSGYRSDYGSRTGRTFSFAIAALTTLWSLVVLGALLAFGFGTGAEKPIAIIMFLAALAVLRRLFFRRRAWARGRGCGRRMRRW